MDEERMEIGLYSGLKVQREVDLLVSEELFGDLEEGSEEEVAG